MNPSSLNALELPKIREWLASLAAFSGGRDLALQLQPSDDFAEVERRLSATAEALALSGARPNLGLGGVYDVRPAVSRAELGGMLSPEELLQVADLLAAVDRWRSALARLEATYPTLYQIVASLDPRRELRAAIANAIGEDGQVLDSASPELARIRQELRSAHDRLLRRLHELVNTASFRQALQEPIVTQREGRYVVPVKADSRSQVRGIVHDQSASGATLFVEPLEVIELANRWRQAEREEAAEIERVLRDLSQQVAGAAPSLHHNVAALAEIDLHQAKARLARQLDAVRPTCLRLPRRPGEPVLRLVDARHPLLERTLGRAAVVPISLELGADFDILLITGPNTGGKTVALKTIGLLTLMAQSGLFIPAAEGSQVAVFAGVYADIGDEQSIEQSLSTFSSHMTRIVEMLETVDDRSLVLLDELGAGTDPEEGAALARALLDELLARGAFCVATSHYSELKVYAHSTPRVENASVEFDVETLSPTYRLLVGLPGRSNALAIASRLGMPARIVERARALLQPHQRQIATMIEQLQEDREAVESARAAAERAERDAAILRDRLRAALEEAERERARAYEQARAESEALLTELRREVRELRRRAERAGRDAPALAEVLVQAQRLQPIRAPRRAAAPEPAGGEPELAPGMEVLVPSLGVTGTILSIADGQAQVDVRGMRVQVRLDELRRAGGACAERRNEPRPREVTLEREARYVPLQLDVRGLTREEASGEVDRYIHDAFMAGLPQVRIVHGRGTGAVRAAVRDLLGGHPLVKQFTPGGPAEGGDGATVVELAV